jgi:hypothetical protein
VVDVDHVAGNWPKLVERFNKMKPKAFDGKGDMTNA